MGMRKSLLPFTWLVAGLVTAHSWVEQLQLINFGGQFYGDYGYPRGYVSRDDPAFNGASNMWLLPSPESGRSRIDDTDYACHPSQQVANYSSTYPMLNVASGDWVSMKYLENGHVTQPWVQLGKPDHAGTVFVYVSEHDEPDTKLVDVLAWNRDGTGGNQLGKLVAALPFDDGRCHQISDAPIAIFRGETSANPLPDLPTTTFEQWCETDVQIFVDDGVAQVRVFWVWQWPTTVGTVDLPYGKDEYYTSCMDFSIVDSVDELTTPSHSLLQQDPQSLAVSHFDARTGPTASPSTFNSRETLEPAFAQALAEAIANPTTSTLYSLAPTVATVDGTIWLLESQGTAVQSNSQTVAYLDCSSMITRGSSPTACLPVVVTATAYANAME